MLVVRLTDRMGRGREPAEGSVPEKGDRIAWTLFEHDQRGGPKLPSTEETPWTHGGRRGRRVRGPDPVPVTQALPVPSSEPYTFLSPVRPPTTRPRRRSRCPFPTR